MRLKNRTMFTLFATMLVIGLIVGLGTAAAAPPNAKNFNAVLSGDQEIASDPVETRARGVAEFQLSNDGTELYYTLEVANIEDVTQAHIHLAPAGVNGPVVAWLYPSGPPAQLIPGRFQGRLAEGVISADDLVGELAGQSLEDLVSEMQDGNTYVNVHTAQYPAGEIRGQIRTAGPQ